MKNQYFISSDLSLVAALLSTKQVELVGHEQVDQTRFEFHLSPKNTCLELQRQYINSRLTVDAKAISDNIKTLKGIIRSGGFNESY